MGVISRNINLIICEDISFVFLKMGNDIERWFIRMNWNDGKSEERDSYDEEKKRINFFV